MPSPFVHLHVHSHYSLLEALPKPKEILKHVLKHGMDAVAITDNGSMYGMIEFYQKAKDAGVKPIFGMDAYLGIEGRNEKRAKIDTKNYRIVLLAETREGYQNLIKIASIGFLEGFYYKPRVDKEVLRSLGKGIIALSGGHAGEIESAINSHDRERAKTLIREYVEIFGDGNFFLELVDRPEIAEQEAINATLIELGKEMGVPVVATKNAFYLKPGDVEAWKVLNCIKGQRTLEAYERQQQYDFDASLVSGEYMIERFKDVPEAIENTRKIADRCTVELELGKWNFPDFKIPEGKTFLDVLTARAYAELPEKVGGTLTEVMTKRLDYELAIIEQKGFCPYFLIVSDYIEWARRNGIVTTTRGSAAGSLVGFSIGISTVNPLVYKLPFERFLNPERPSAPDVDADFADNRRDEMMAYVTEKYGADKVAQICTFGTMAARGSVRDVGRVLGYDYQFVDKISKSVPMGSQGFPMTLEIALQEAPELKKLYDVNAEVHRLIDLARQVEGCARHVSIHAAGVVISPTALTDFTPLQIDTREGKTITQYEMHAVESAGLVKMDFLGIRNLSILGDAIKLVKQTKNADIILEKIPVDDKKTFELLAAGKTMGTFQLNGDGMTKYLMDLRPERVEDIMAMVALYRPGPIESIPEYIRRKHNPSLVKFMDPRMKDILDQSYGVIVYQDDVMLIAIHLAGYSWLDADKLRKAMGKKIPEEMQKQKEKLLSGFVEHGLTMTKAQDIWKLIEPFAAYGFNKAHAASYGMIAYDTAYMKANYPAEYMTSIMTAESSDIEKVAEAVTECRRMGIDVLSPDINESRLTFTYINDKTIRFGLIAIKNLGEEVIESIIAEREAKGPFLDLADFARRVHHRAFNKKSIEALVKTGALDRFGDRNQLLENMDRILLFNKDAQRQLTTNQGSLFDAAPSVATAGITLRVVPPAAKRDVLQWEKELLGLFVSAHPYEDVAKQLGDTVLSVAVAITKPDAEFVRVGGIITTVKEIVTKKGDAMAFVGFEDLTGKTELLVFPRTFAQFKESLLPDTIMVVSAKVSRRKSESSRDDDVDGPGGEEVALIANSLVLVSDSEAAGLGELLKSGGWIDEEQRSKFQKTEDPKAKAAEQPSVSIALRGRPDHDMVERLRGILRANPGPRRVCLLVESGGQTRKIETEYSILATSQVIDEIAGIVGRQNVVAD
ncbi:MAG: DNA polymerase III subunit alpha [Candidatus Uhrbacteria bacterium]